MALHIRNKKTQLLARTLAHRTGESLTEAVTHALRDRLERLDRERETPLAKRLLAIGRDCAAHLKEPHASVPHGDLLYDEAGLPR